MSKYCRNCGGVLDDNATFCNKCGAKIDSAPGVGPVPPYGSNFPPIANNSLSSNEAIFNMGILVAGILVIIASLLPYVTFTVFGQSKSVSLLLTDGSSIGDFFLILLTIGVVVCTFLNQRLPAMVLSILNFIRCIFTAVTMAVEDNVSYAFDLGVAKWGIGFYLVLIAALALVVLSVLSYVSSTNSTKKYPM